MSSLQFSSMEKEGASFNVPSHVSLRISARAKRLGLRVDSEKGGFILTLPPRVHQKHIDDFLEKAQSWMEKQNATASPSLFFESGLEIPFQGHLVKLVYLEQSGPRSVVYKYDEIEVSAPKAAFHDQVVAFLKKQARDVFKEICHELSKQLPRTFFKKPIPLQSISIKDMKTRWGSCSSKGAISLSWRLILAPKEVARYVCIHEVCHLSEMNHSAKFWALVAEFDPDYKIHKSWLKQHGKELCHYQG